MTTREKEKLERKYVEMRDLLEDLSMQIEEIREEYIYEMDDLEDEETQLDRKGQRVDMCQAIADMREEERQAGRQEGIQEGRQESYRRTIRNMLKRGDSLEEIAEILELPIETVKAWG